MLLRLKIATVQPVALLLGHDHGATASPRRLAGALPPGGRASTRTKRLRSVAVAMALKEEEPENSRSRFARGGPIWDPRMEIGVPYEQRPVNEYSALKDSTLYSWAELSPGSFFMRLGSLCLVTFTVLAAPISAASFSPGKDPLKFVLAAGIGTLLLVSLVVLRIYLMDEPLNCASMTRPASTAGLELTLVTGYCRQLCRMKKPDGAGSRQAIGILQGKAGDQPAQTDTGGHRCAARRGGGTLRLRRPRPGIRPLLQCSPHYRLL